MKTRTLVLFLSLAGMIPGMTMAKCAKVTSPSSLSTAAIAAGYTAASWKGASSHSNSLGSLGLPAVISVSSSNGFQPSGTLLGASRASFLTGAVGGYTSNQILIRCDVADADSLYEMYATNAQYNTTGRYAASEVEGAYYTYARNVALRLTNTRTGLYYTNYWQTRQLTADDWYSDGTYIYIPASAFSDVMVELFKIDSTSYSSNSSNYWSWSYSRGSGFVTFRGPGYTYPADGAMQGNITGWSSGYWPAGWNLANYITIVRGAACRVNDYPSVVPLPPISASELSSGGASQAGFSVSIECESGAKSSTSKSTISSANVAMGFMVNNATAASAATALGLTTSGGGLTWLLDNHYGAGGNVASGVGVRIYDSNGVALNLLPDLSSTGTGNTRGWYAFKALTEQVSSGSTDMYSGDFTASLEAINSQTVTVGTVNAQLQVVVIFQ